ncbi:MAG: hypothetical protein JRI68_09125 [Deltaproteobacteria bacterium]|nr:hypothetical protein [Deltaproteobacteria bacterium]
MIARIELRWLLAALVLLTAPTLTACADLTRSDPFVVIKDLPKPPPPPAAVAPAGARAGAKPGMPGQAPKRRTGG